MSYLICFVFILSTFVTPIFCATETNNCDPETIPSRIKRRKLPNLKKKHHQSIRAAAFIMRLTSRGLPNAAAGLLVVHALRAVLDRFARFGKEGKRKRKRNKKKKRKKKKGKKKRERERG